MTNTTVKKVAVLMGGWSGEREVSLASGTAMAKAAKALGHTVYTVDPMADLGKLVEQLNPRPDVVINGLHGVWGEDGRIQAILDLMHIPYTHSGVLASSLAMDKVAAKKVFHSEDIPTPNDLVVPANDAFSSKVMDFPYVLKPINEGSSLGVYIIERESDIVAPQGGWQFGNDVMAERYIPGRELSVAIMGDRALGTMELCPKSGFFDYKSKYTRGMAEFKTPAPVPEAISQKVLDLGLRAHKSLGCTGVTRVDLRYDDTAGELYVLEVNTQPGMTELSQVPQIASKVGFSFNDLVEWMIEDALCRNPNR